MDHVTSALNHIETLENVAGGVAELRFQLREHRRRVAELERALNQLMQSRDVAWEQGASGEDWADAVRDAREVLAGPGKRKGG